MYDAKCLELAEHFLPKDASEAHKNGLAQFIQDNIEDYLAAYKEGKARRENSIT
jgi:hypothetical protein